MLRKWSTRCLFNRLNAFWLFLKRTNARSLYSTRWGVYSSPHLGSVAERLKAPVLKTGDGKASVGSNPTLSANWKNTIDLRKYPRGRRGSPAKGVGRVKSVAEVQILSSAPRKARENVAFSLAFSFISLCFAIKSSILAFQKMPLPLSLPQLDFLPLKTAERSSTGRLTSGASFYAFFSFS